MVKTPCCDETGLKKGTWTQEEDRKLIEYVTRYGCWNWRRLPKFAGLSRCGKSCRLRWLNYLRPNIKRGNFSKEEENIIIRLHEAQGNKWSMIAAKLDGRTDNEVKNHWHTNLKKRFKNMKSHEGKKKKKDTEKRGPKPAANDSVINTTSDQILESFPRSPPPPRPTQPSSSSESSNMMITNWQVGYDHNETNSPPVTTAYADISGDSVINTTSDQILECFPRSPPPPPPSSSSESSNIITTNWQDGYDHNETNSPPVTAYADISGDFWTDPFVADNFYVGQDYNVVSLIDPEFSFSQCPVSSEELLGQFGFYDEQDCLSWLMQLQWEM